LNTLFTLKYNEKVFEIFVRKNILADTD